MTSPGKIKRTHVLAEEGQKSSGRNSALVENNESLTDAVKQLKELKEKNKQLAEKFERLEALVQKISATEGKPYRDNSVLYL